MYQIINNILNYCLYFYRFFEDELEKIGCISSNLSCYVVQQDLLDNPPRVGKRKAIAIAKENFTRLYGPDEQGSAATTGSVV